MSQSLSKFEIMTKESQSYKKLATLTLALILSIGIVRAMSFVGQSQLVAPIDIDNLFAELFWIGVFSLTAKAALSISYD